jgi:hypothetical protein
VVALPQSDAISGIEVSAVTICPSGGSLLTAFVLAALATISVDLTSKALSSLAALQSKDAGARQPEADQIDSTELVGRIGNRTTVGTSP